MGLVAVARNEVGLSTGALTGGGERISAAWRVWPGRPRVNLEVIAPARWGGLWGIPLALVLRRAGVALVPWLIVGLVFGAVLPSLAGWFIVAPLKGLPMGAGGDPARMLVGLVVNGAWGLGTAVVLWLSVAA